MATVAVPIAVGVLAIIGGLLIERYRRRNQVSDAGATAKQQELIGTKELKIEEARFLVEQWQRLHGEQAGEIRSLRDDLDVERQRVTRAETATAEAAQHAETCEHELTDVRRELDVVKRQMRDASRSLGDDGVIGGT